MADQPTDVFNQDPQVTPATSPADPQDAYADLLKSITNEAGEQKYGDLPKALEGLKNAQEYIPQLKSENSDKDRTIAELQAELDKRSTVEDVVNRLTANQDSGNAEPQVTPQVTGLDEQAVIKLVTQLSEQKERESALRSNRDKVNQQLSATFGDKAAEAIAAKAKELNTTAEQLGKLSESSPEVVLNLFQAQAPSGVKPTQSSFNIPPRTPAQEELAAPDKSLLAGATSKEQAAFMAKIRERVYSKFDIQE